MTLAPPEESLSLKLMRLYRLGELIRYYTGWLLRSEEEKMRQRGLH